MKTIFGKIDSTGLKLGAILLGAGFSPAIAADDPTNEGTNEGMDEVQGGESKQACFYARDASNFDVLDRSNFVVYAPTKSHAFHVRIAPPASELRFANGLAFEGRSNRICGYAGETVAFGGSGMGRRYSITNVRRLDAAALEYLLDTYPSGDSKKLPEPKDSEGADVERDLSGGEEH
jgi:hypothetical protein